MRTTTPVATGELEQFHEACLNLGRAHTPTDVLQTLLDVVLPLSGAGAGTIHLDLGTPASSSTIPVSETASSLVVRGGEDKVFGEEGGVDAGDDLTIPLRIDHGAVGILHLHRFAATPSERALLIIELLCEQTAQRLSGVLRERGNRDGDNILNGLREPVYICDGNGLITDANAAFCDFVDRPLGQIHGLRVGELLEALPQYQHLTERHEPAGHIFEFRFGNPLHIFRETRLALQDGRQVRSLHEITEQRRLQEQLRHIEKLAALGELISGITHELNNPLATIIGYAQLLETDQGLPPRAQRGLSHMHLEAQRASQIVTSLRAFAGRSAPEKTRVDINELLHDLNQMKVSQLSEDDIQLSEDFAEDLPAVWGDAPQLQRLFLSIINNAAQAMRDVESSEPERPRVLQITTRSMPGSAGEKQGVRIDIIDNGPGIPPDHLHRVFEPYFTTKPLGRGAGLGLSIAADIVAEHNGEIRVESEPGEGARFIIELLGMPSLGAVAANGLAGWPGVGNRSADVSPASILVVGETPAGVTPIVAALTEMYEVTACYGGAEATVLLAGGDYDLIVATVEAPRGSEPSFFESLQSIPLDLLPHLLFVVDNNVPPSVRQFLRDTEAPVLTVPIEPEILCGLVRQILKGEK